MAPESRHESASVSERLLREPYRFDFFQAVRLLERLEAEQGRSCYPVGHDRLPAQEAVRLRALPGLSFPAGEISQIRPRDTQGNDNLPPEMIVTFMGLTGPAGVLPQHYTTLLLQRLRSRDTTLRDFLDLFNHRMLSLFYRAWEKYRFPLAYERSRLDKGGTINQETPADSDLFGQGLYALVGLGLPGAACPGGARQRSLSVFRRPFCASAPTSGLPGKPAERAFWRARSGSSIRRPVAVP